MPKVNLPSADWDTILEIIDMCKRTGQIAYVDSLVKDIEDQLATQEN